jgi:CheY-like chemotaxis protein
LSATERFRDASHPRRRLRSAVYRHPYGSLGFSTNNNARSNQPILLAYMAPTVLVVDDERAQGELLRRWLDSWGYQVRLARHAREALDVVHSEPVDILLADIRMPGHDGFWLVERVRAQWPQTAIILATGVVEPETVKKAELLGVVDYVSKPFSQEVLRQALDRAERWLKESADPGRESS